MKKRPFRIAAPNRRTALKTIGSAGVALFGASKLSAHSPPLFPSPVELTVTAITRYTTRITIQPVDNTPNNDGALTDKNFPPPLFHWRTPIAGSRRIHSGDVLLNLTASDIFTIRATHKKDGRLIQEFKLDPTTGQLTFPLADSPIFGLGQGGPQFDRHGSIDHMGNGQAAYKLATHGARLPIQFIISTGHNSAFFIHQPLGTFDLTNVEGVFHPSTALPLDLFVVLSPTPTAILTEYAHITGFPEMPPLWSLGYQQSHRTLASQDETLAEAQLFREKKLPCDALIYLGTDFCPNGWNTHNGEFTWNANAFPNPPSFIERLHNLHFKVALHIVIEGHHLTGTVHDPCTNPSQPAGRTPDGHWPEERSVSCYWPAHKPLLDLGIDGWWPDQGDGLDAPSRLARNRMYFDGQQMDKPNERIYALHRNGYAGMQRYAAFLWSGDVQSTWETLKTHIAVGINTGLSGIPFWGTDIGGFVPTSEYTGELYARWFQFAAFCPLFRSHGRVWTLHLPWGWNLGEPSPAVRAETPKYQPDPAEFHNAAIEPICKKYLELRYQLLPYIYSAVKETCETGIPIIRALWLHHPTDKAAVTCGDEYLFGRDILVAPIFEKGATTRSLYLPSGDWYDFWTHERLSGARQISRPIDLATVPLYIRAGAIIPIGPVKQHTAEITDAPITLRIHPGSDGAFSLYEDDGHTFNFRQGEFTRINFTWHDRQRRLTASQTAGPRTNRTFLLQLAGQSTTQEFNFRNQRTELKL